LFVSHDHDFVNELATSIIELTPISALIYPGNYDSYLQQKDYQNGQSNGSRQNYSASQTAAPAVKVVSFFEQKQIRKLEQAIDRLGKERIKLTAELENLTYGTPEFQTRYDRLQKIGKEEPELVAQWEKYQ